MSCADLPPRPVLLRVRIVDRVGGNRKLQRIDVEVEDLRWCLVPGGTRSNLGFSSGPY